ncbi:MAG: ATP-dependent helicase, partial [Candidatus Cloacimonetes bacterium]|nr:ATP-dependent helicase [Candidatus Cloacimonadota bacterium]
VLTVDGATLLLAVPGSGKTTVIISRIGNMIINHSIKPEKILTLTFSVSAARDMQERFASIFGKIIECNLEFKTIHSFSYSVIKEYEHLLNTRAFNVLENNNSVIKQIYLELNNQYIGEDILKEITQKIGYCKNMMINEDGIKKINIPSCNFEQIFTAYETYKKQNQIMDYDDMLNYAYTILKKYPNILSKYQNQFKYINVDEAQDTSFIQHEIIRLIAQKNGNIFMVGDEDQSIYGFRAAFPKALLNFKDNYKNANILLIEQNYRSTKIIVEAANRFIKQNRDRYQKNMFCENIEGLEIKETKLNNLNDQYKYIVDIIKREGKKKKIAVLYRNNDSAIPIVDALEREKIPFFIKENKPTFFSHFITNDIINFIRLSQDANDINAFEKIYYKMNCGINKIMFEFVKKNKIQNVFDTLLTFPELKEYVIEKINKIKFEFEKLKDLQAFKAIEHIENKIGYSYNLMGLSNKGFSQEILTQKMNILKSIAFNTDTINDFLERLSQLEEIFQNSVSNNFDVILTTIHSSKGLEFDKVILIDVIDGQFPSQESITLMRKLGDRTLFEEEVRLFYVGITRAKAEIEVITSDFLNEQSISMSQFIGDLFPKSKENNKITIYTKKHINIDSSLLGRFDVNAKVTHKTFGNGIIVGVNGAIIDVSFIKNGFKTLYLPACIENNLLELIS